MTLGQNAICPEGCSPERRWIVSACLFVSVVVVHVEPPLESGLANFPCAIADDSIEKDAAIVLAVPPLLVRELYEFGRNFQSLRHVVLTRQNQTPFPPKRENPQIETVKATTVPRLRISPI